MATVLKIPINEVYWYFAITCFSAPLCGVIFIILLFNCLGGYNKPRSLDAACIIGILACLASIPTPFVDSQTSFYVLIWFVFFFGSIIIAPIIGIMLNQVPARRRTVANSMATLSYNLFGYLPAPFVFGFFADFWDSKMYSMRFALGVVLYWSIIACVFMCGAYILILKRNLVLQRLDRVGGGGSHRHIDSLNPNFSPRTFGSQVS